MREERMNLIGFWDGDSGSLLLFFHLIFFLSYFPYLHVNIEI